MNGSGKDRGSFNLGVYLVNSSLGVLKLRKRKRKEKNQYQAKLENGIEGEVYRSSFTHRTVFPLWEDNEEGREVDMHSFTTYDILNHRPEQLSSECPHCISLKT